MRKPLVDRKLMDKHFALSRGSMSISLTTTTNALSTTFSCKVIVCSCFNVYMDVEDLYILQAV
jgi:hypothetical protein